MADAGFLLACFLAKPTVVEFILLAITVEIARRVKPQEVLFTEALAEMTCRCGDLKDLKSEASAEKCLSCLAREATNATNDIRGF